MIDSPERRHFARWLVRLGTLLMLWLALGCSGGQEVTSEAIEKAKDHWSGAGIRDYDLDWVTTGRNNSHYFVKVRGNAVRQVDSVLTDGRTIELHPGEPRFYGVDGLFLTIADELAQLRTDTPFGQPKGTKVVMRFKADPKLGYPLWYRRDVLGTLQSVSIDVLKLVPLVTPISK